MHFLVNVELVCYVLRTNSCTFHIVRSVHCELTDKMYQHQLHAQSLSALSTDKTQHAAYRTGSSSDQKTIDVRRARSQLEGRQFVINNKLYSNFYEN